ncbi:tetratricopeptide repeat-containing sulfotransferase family protein [Magnetofaba australis]|uniref:Uncharacterized protein n=1 Tax=Magnetofaba australis IT-1 TaxID=1434232 RepID=A0A1Y2K1P5_9PROT|nr:sulfotransferase [Magnetofaba australis]OSM00241.1 hypothetical protein MAIT1_00709 [Magnetofaba australis IT-1]
MSTPADARIERLLQECAAHAAAGRAAQAWTACERILHSAPNHPLALAKQSELALAAGDLNRAEQLARRNAQANPQSAQAQMSLGTVLGRRNQADAAQAAFEQAAALEPANPLPYTRLAAMQLQRGQPAAAETEADRALERDPRFAEALLIRARCDVARGMPEQAVMRLVRVAPHTLDPDLRMAYYFDLATAQEAGRKPDQAMASFHEANRLFGLHKLPRNLDREALPKQLIHAIGRFSPEWAATWPPAPPEEFAAPTFVVGFPQAGGELLMRVLCAHPRIAVAWEEDLLADVKKALGPGAWPDVLAQLDGDRIRALRMLLRHAIKRRLGELTPGTQLIVKRMLNIHEAGLIHRLLPSARFLLMLRHPADHCLSAFTRRCPQTMHAPQLLTLEGSVKLYAQTMSLWLRTAQALPQLHALPVRYEQLTGDSLQCAQGVLNFLGVPWSDTVRAWRAAPVNRARFGAQGAPAIKPPPTDPRWRAQLHTLRPYMPILKPYLDAFGYASSQQK